MVLAPTAIAVTARAAVARIDEIKNLRMGLPPTRPPEIRVRGAQ